MTCGIYCYRDTLKDNKVVYVGKDSNIHINKRHKDHYQPSNYNSQQINRILQNNPDRYSYHVLKKGDFDEGLLNALEIIYTHRYSPQFSFTIGGDGTRGYRPSEESRKKMSDAHKGYVPSIETRKKLSLIRKGMKHSEETKKKLSERKIGEKNPQYRDDIPSGEELFLMNKNGLTYKEIGEKFNCHYKTVYYRVKKYKESIMS